MTEALASSFSWEGRGQGSIDSSAPGCAMGALVTADEPLAAGRCALRSARLWPGRPQGRRMPQRAMDGRIGFARRDQSGNGCWSSLRLAARGMGGYPHSPRAFSERRGSSLGGDLTRLAERAAKSFHLSASKAGNTEYSVFFPEPTSAPAHAAPSKRTYRTQRRHPGSSRTMPFPRGFAAATMASLRVPTCRLRWLPRAWDGPGAWSLDLHAASEVNSGTTEG